MCLYWRLYVFGVVCMCVCLHWRLHVYVCVCGNKDQVARDFIGHVDVYVCVSVSDVCGNFIFIAMIVCMRIEDD